MQRALSPYTAAGVALATAGVIAVTPLAPPARGAHLPALSSQASVELSAFTNPNGTWAAALTAAAGNTQAIDSSSAVTDFGQPDRLPVPYRGADSDWATIFNTTSANVTWLAELAGGRALETVEENLAVARPVGGNLLPERTP